MPDSSIMQIQYSHGIKLEALTVTLIYMIVLNAWRELCVSSLYSTVFHNIVCINMETCSG